MEPLDLARILKVPQLPANLVRVEKELADVLQTDNPSISKPLKRLLKTHGKRLRASLVIAAAGKFDEKVINGCVAVELTHLGSLVHDDIIDKAASRRNIPTVNSKEGISRAIIVGDYLLAKACQQAAKISARAGQLMASTITELCDGQSRELADQFNVNRTLSSYRSAINGKTASLISAACVVGGLCASLNASHINSLAKYGENLGMAFQLLDDVLDLVSTEKLLGKPTGNDMKEGVYTMPVILALQSPHRQQLLSHLQIATKLQFDSKSMDLLQSGLQNTIEEAKKYTKQARQSMDGFTAGKLPDLPDAYLNWALENLVAKEYKEKARGRKKGFLV